MGHAEGVIDTHLDTERCYRALASRDERFDGRFITGVTTTGIYCRPSCPAVRPKRTNVRFFPTAAAAQRAGLRACKRCRPDATPGSPEWDVRADLVGRAMRLIADGLVDRGGVAALAERLNVGDRHLRRLLQSEVGAGPLALARANRAQTARTLIETTDLPFSQVAFASGFSSIRQFNATIVEVFAVPPRTMRERGKGGGRTDGIVVVRLPFRPPLAAAQLFGWLAYRAIPGVAEGDATAHRRALRLPRGRGLVTLTARDDHILCELELDELRDLATAVERCRRLLDLDADPQAVSDVLERDPLLAPMVRRRPGLRVPGSVDGTESAAFAVLGQQRSVAAARTLAGRIVDRVVGAHEELVPFPTAQELADTDLDGLGLTTRGIQTLHDVGARIDSGAIVLDPGADRGVTRGRLLDIAGVGPWTADYIAMRALGDPDVALPGDLVVRKSADAHGLSADQAALVQRSTAWRPWRSYAMHHLWAATADPPTTDSQPGDLS